MMDWSSPSNIATNLLAGNLVAILVTCVLAFSLPLILHLFLYRTARTYSSNDFLLLGPSGSGKTALCSLLERRSTSLATPRSTHTSQTSSLVSISLPPTIITGTNRFRSVNDPSLNEATKNPVQYRLRDTPGHGKLRDSQGISLLPPMSSTKKVNSTVRGVVFMVDAAALSEGDEALRDAAGYLHDVLMALQERTYNISKRFSRNLPNIPILVAANKQDLFTALPSGSVRDKLEIEIEKVRQSRRKGLLDASVNPGMDEKETDMLGGDEQEKHFSFKMLEDATGIKVDVIGGAVKSDEDSQARSGVQHWEEWIGSCL